MQSPTHRAQSFVSLAVLCAILVGFAGYDALFAQGTPRSYHSAIFDTDWNYWANPPHLFSTPLGNVGIGVTVPSEKLEVDGVVYSNTGGFKFPDGTTQLTAISPGTPYANVFTVAQSGGDFTTITAALGACVAPSSTNRYLIRVMPGTYAESVTCQSWVRLQAAGKYACRIEGGVLGADDSTVHGFEIASGIRCFGTSPTLIENLVTNEGDGIWITDGGKPWIEQNEIRDCGGWGVHCDGWDTNAWIISNKIEENQMGGIRCRESAPTISNNQILSNLNYGIYLIGALGTPSEPTIDDNVIGRTGPPPTGVGIYMTEYAEPRIIGNDIWVNGIGIEVHDFTQPSILSNNVNYNQQFGIRVFSNGASKRVVVQGNHVHSNPTAGIDVVNASPMIDHNNVSQNDAAGINPDISYIGPPFPTISLNVVDRMPSGTGATGLFNVTSGGLAIAP